MNKVIFSTNDNLLDLAAITFYGDKQRLFSLFYAPNGFSKKDIAGEVEKYGTKAFIVQTGFESHSDYDNLSEAVADFEARSGAKLNETPMLAAFKAYVVAELFFVF